MKIVTDALDGAGGAEQSLLAHAVNEDGGDDENGGAEDAAASDGRQEMARFFENSGQDIGEVVSHNIDIRPWIHHVHADA